MKYARLHSKFEPWKKYDYNNFQRIPGGHQTGVHHARISLNMSIDESNIVMHGTVYGKECTRICWCICITVNYWFWLEESRDVPAVWGLMAMFPWLFSQWLVGWSVRASWISLFNFLISIPRWMSCLCISLCIPSIRLLSTSFSFSLLK